jgi:hypothetical protein
VKDLTAYGFELNPYDPCVANKMVNGQQLTVSWHVDNLKASHKDPKVIDQFIQWIKDTYGSIGEVKVTRGKIHEYLGMKLDYSVPGQVSIDMSDYVQSMIDGFPYKQLKGVVASPWNEHLFKVQEDSSHLSPEWKELFHTVTAQGLFLCKRARPDICPAIAYLTTRVQAPNEDDWSKLVRLMKFLNQTVKDVLTLRADGTWRIKWHVDASFAVHIDMRSHTGAAMTMGKGAITSISRKQGMNTRSSTEAEVVAADEVVGPMLWTKNFLEAQGYPVKENILYQDNQSAMLLESNGRKSAGKRSRHLNIRYFFVADQKEKGNISIEYCPTDQMIGDYMTKPTHGKKFRGFRQQILNLPTAAQLVAHCCVVKTVVQLSQFCTNNKLSLYTTTSTLIPAKFPMTSGSQYGLDTPLTSGSIPPLSPDVITRRLSLWSGQEVGIKLQWLRAPSTRRPRRPYFSSIGSTIQTVADWVVPAQTASAEEDAKPPAKSTKTG